MATIRLALKKEKNFFAISPVVFAPGTQTCATELTMN
jgi:predicted metal-dependent enzyme (double-stranded beta helix superfamily)